MPSKVKTNLTQNQITISRDVFSAKQPDIDRSNNHNN